MKRNILSLTLVIACAVLTSCDKETRKGELTLSGAAPIRFVSKDGKTVEYYAGPTKVELSAKSRDKVTVIVSQGDKKAVFSGKVSGGDDWNFVLRGKTIGQPMDMSSRRQLTYTGKVWYRISGGGFCGFNGRWVVEDKLQKCDEDWNVAFTDANTSAPLGAFRSRQNDMTCLISSRNIYCRDDHRAPFPLVSPRFD